MAIKGLVVIAVGWVTGAGKSQGGVVGSTFGANSEYIDGASAARARWLRTVLATGGAGAAGTTDAAFSLKPCRRS